MKYAPCSFYAEVGDATGAAFYRGSMILIFISFHVIDIYTRYSFQQRQNRYFRERIMKVFNTLVYIQINKCWPYISGTAAFPVSGYWCPICCFYPMCTGRVSCVCCCFQGITCFILVIPCLVNNILIVSNINISATPAKTTWNTFL